MPASEHVYNLLAPQVLTAGLLLPVLGLLFVFLEKKRRVKLALLQDLSDNAPVQHNKVLRLLLPFAIIIPIWLSLTRPYSGSEEIPVPRAGRDFMFIVDVSLSMQTKDVSPSRIVQAKRKIEDSVKLLKSYNQGDKLGLVLFAGDSYLYCPLTSDYGILTSFAKNISTEMITSGGSAINQAVETSLKSFNAAKAQHPTLILLSDGEDSSLNVETAIAQVKKAGLTLNTIGFGTTEGKPIDISPNSIRSQFVKDNAGNIVVSKLNEESLQKMANSTGGKYFSARVDDGDLREILPTPQSLGEINTATSQQTTVVYHEVGPLFLWIVLFVLVWAFIVKRPEVLFNAIALLIFLPAPSHADTPVQANSAQEQAAAKNANVSSLYEAAKAYDSGDYSAALEHFKAALSRSPDDYKLLESTGSAEYKLNKFDQAIKSFNKAKEAAKNGKEKFESSYNLANAKLQAKQYEQALSEYDEALKIKPADTAATFNRELAAKLLEQKKQEEEQKKQQQKDNKQDQKQNKDQQNKDNQNKEEQQKDQSNKDQEQNQQQENKEKSDSSPSGDKSKDEQAKPSPSEGENKSSEGAPSPTPTSQEGAQGLGEQSKDEASPSPSPQGNQGQSTTESPQPSASPEPTPGEAASGNEASDSSGEAGEQEKASATMDPKALKTEEAQAWLDSLSDSPVLLRQLRGRGHNRSGQNW